MYIYVAGVHRKKERERDRVCIQYKYIHVILTYIIYIWGDRLGSGHIRVLYKAPEYYTKPQNIIQRHKILTTS